MEDTAGAEDGGGGAGEEETEGAGEVCADPSIKTLFGVLTAEKTHVRPSFAPLAVVASVEMGATVVAKSSVTNGVCDAVFSVGEGGLSDAYGDGEQGERSGQLHG